MVSFAFTPTTAVKANQCMSDCSVGACRGSSAISWTLHQQMELYWWGWFEGLQMEDAVSVLPRGHFIRPLLQLRFSASLQTSPVVFLNHLTSPAATQMAPESPQTATFTHTRRGSWSQEVNIIISGDNWRKEKEAMPTLMGCFTCECRLCVNNAHNSIWHMAAVTPTCAHVWL